MKQQLVNKKPTKPTNINSGSVFVNNSNQGQQTAHPNQNSLSQYNAPQPQSFSTRKKILSALAISWVAPLIGLICATIYISLSSDAGVNSSTYITTAFFVLLPFGPIGVAIHAVAFWVSTRVLLFLNLSREFMRKSDKKLNINNALIVYLIAQIPLIAAILIGYTLILIWAADSLVH